MTVGAVLVFLFSEFSCDYSRSLPSYRLRGKVLILASVMLLLGSAAARKEHYGQGLTVDLDAPYDQAVKAVQEIAENGTIQGTWQYKGTTELDGASSAKSAAGFPAWNGQGAVFYKVRPKTIAPQHFYATADQGTVAVRYILEPGGANTTKLRIEAVFEEDDHHHSHPSDGQVENSEYTAITEKFKEYEAQEKKRAESSALDEQGKKVEQLKEALDQENANLKALTMREQALQRQAAKAPGGELVRVRTASADLKAAPYNAARTLQLLSRGQPVTVLARAGGWCRVQTGHGEQGWVFHQMLEGVR
jgi:hypothetical protein